MHYRNGREVQVGDPVVGLVGNQKGTVGSVVHAIAGADACNLHIATFQTMENGSNNPMIGNFVAIGPNGMATGTTYIYGTAAEFLHAEDAAEQTLLLTEPGAA